MFMSGDRFPSFQSTARLLVRMVVAWIAGYVITRLLTSGLSASVGYSWLSAWWLTTCLLMCRCVTVRQGLWLVAISVTISAIWEVISVLNDGETGFPFSLIKIVARGVLLVSPLLASSALGMIESIVRCRGVKAVPD